jgi:hypothetical protein
VEFDVDAEKVIEKYRGLNADWEHGTMQGRWDIDEWTAYVNEIF